MQLNKNMTIEEMYDFYCDVRKNPKKYSFTFRDIDVDDNSVLNKIQFRIYCCQQLNCYKLYLTSKQFHAMKAKIFGLVEDYFCEMFDKFNKQIVDSFDNTIENIFDKVRETKRKQQKERKSVTKCDISEEDSASDIDWE